jgi:hypothetical protein
MLWSMMVRVVIHAEAFVRIRVAIDIRFFRYSAVAATGLSILMSLQYLYHEISHLKLI